jgi:DNA-binding transcriptional ArsR family regulator
MDEEGKFVLTAGLICEPARAKMLWNLLDGRAYTASELAFVSDISVTSASNHLSKLLEADILKFEMQGRNRYYTFSNVETAYVVEALANLAGNKETKRERKKVEGGIRYCRTCYDHLAGFAGVSVTGAMVKKSFLKNDGISYLVTKRGWNWLKQFDIVQKDFSNIRRPLTRQCIDWSERRPHLAGQLGAVLLEKLMQRKWFRKVQFSREMIITARGRQEAYELLGFSF